MFLGAENKKSSPPLTREPMDGFFSGLNQSVALTFKFNKGLYDQCRRMLSSPPNPEKTPKIPHFTHTDYNSTTQQKR